MHDVTQLSLFAHLVLRTADMLLLRCARHLVVGRAAPASAGFQRRTVMDKCIKHISHCWKLAEVQPGTHCDYPQMTFTEYGVASEPGGLV